MKTAYVLTFLSVDLTMKKLETYTRVFVSEESAKKEMIADALGKLGYETYEDMKSDEKIGGSYLTSDKEGYFVKQDIETLKDVRDSFLSSGEIDSLMVENNSILREQCKWNCEEMQGKIKKWEISLVEVE